MPAVAERLTELHWLGFERLTRLAIERGAGVLVVAGDLFDKPSPPARLVERVRGVFRRLAAEGIAVVLVPGTHDAAHSSRSVYSADALAPARIFLNPRLGERLVVGRSGTTVAFQGLAWDPQGTPADFLADFHRGEGQVPEVLVLHGEVGSAGSRRGKDLPASTAQLTACGADYVAMGHRHAFLELRGPDRLWGAYAGSPFGFSFKEPELGPRSACLVDLGEPGGPRIELVATTTVEWLRLKLDLSQFATRDELLAVIVEASGAERLALVELTGAAAFPLSSNELEAEMAGHFLYVAVEDFSVEVSTEALDRMAAEQSVRGVFARRMAARLAAARSPADRTETSAAIREGLRAPAEDER